MAFKDDADDPVDCEIVESYGVFSEGTKNWNKEVNLVSWNGRPAKLDIRSWQKDHAKCGKGITITREEAEELFKILGSILKEKPAAAKPKRPKKTPPQTLEPFYDELELVFGAEPDECKTARNALLKKYHPDRNAANVAFATRKTIKIKEAYDAIMDWWNENQ
jgi:hypothetical protein